jgi:hypothetical protein
VPSRRRRRDEIQCYECGGHGSVSRGGITSGGRP